MPLLHLWEEVGTHLKFTPRIVRDKETCVNKASRREQEATTSMSLFPGNDESSAFLLDFKQRDSRYREGRVYFLLLFLLF